MEINVFFSFVAEDIELVEQFRDDNSKPYFRIWKFAIIR